MIKRIFIIVLDSLGIGAMPDADQYGDVGSDTLCAIVKSPAFYAPNLARLGLFNIDGINCGKPTPTPLASFARCAEKSKGKDTTIGHWEIAGLISTSPLPTYPNGFPREVIAEFERRTGRKTLCNKPYSGTQVIKDYGKEHRNTGALIVYTSADSVFQIAAHEAIVPPEELYNYCRIARDILTGANAVGRVIARPFEGEHPFARTPRRKDYSLVPPQQTMLDALKAEGLATISVGKIFDIFAGKGISESNPAKSNAECMEILAELLAKNFKGLCFANLVDFDMLYGHRNDVDGYAGALAVFDRWLRGFINRLASSDMLIITADHGCDPSTPGTDHTREYTPLLVYGEKIKKGVNLGVRDSFADIAATVAEAFGLPPIEDGTSFYKDIIINA